MSTQWNVGMAGATGLVYSSLPFVFEMVGIDRARWPTVFEQIRQCESEALKVFAERK